ncbi:hypothetical protein WT59_22040 [Burkholderia territorii]|nr:FliM/FliN family flagellar motor C-terminal domain-containing protein [Burkholderia territorii]KWH08515.1 hypothetical protein WT59_22040 [Burkholderia territorii]
MLGRPTHLLDAFGATLGQSLAQFFETHVGRLRGTALNVRNVSIETRAADMRALPWRRRLIGGATIAIHLERALLLTLLELRYGPPAAPAVAPRENDAATTDETSLADAPVTEPPTAAAPAGSASPPTVAVSETSTERRLAQKLATDLAETMAACIVPLSTLDDAKASVDTDTHPHPLELFVSCEIEDSARGAVGMIGFALDAVWQQRLFAHLKSTMSRGAGIARNGTPLASQLRIRLTAQLMETEVPFGDLLRLRPGSILPVRLHAAARVLASGTQVFSATIAEHDGKLCLTSFDYVE